MKNMTWTDSLTYPIFKFTCEQCVDWGWSLTGALPCIAYLKFAIGFEVRLRVTYTSVKLYF